MGGIGGSVAYADPTLGYSFAYTTSLLADFNRVDALATAVLDCLRG